MKRILLTSIVSMVFMVVNAVALAPVSEVPGKITYFTGWGQTAGAATKFIEKSTDPSFTTSGSRIDALFLSFLRWDGLGNIKDDNFMLYSTGWKSKEYNALRTIYTASTDGTIPGKKVKFIASFGGYSYAGIWDVLLEDSLREQVARNIVALMGNKIGKFWDGYKDIPEVNIDGIDFDFERSVRMTPELNDAFIKLVERIRVLQNDSAVLNELGVDINDVKDDIIILTTYHVGVDPVNCGINLKLGPKDGCSFVNEKRSAHHGESVRLFEKLKGKNLFDGYNVMLYDAGKDVDFHPEVAIDNYLKYLPADRFNGGISIKSQWGPSGSFVQTEEKNAALIKLFKSKGLHGYFTWSTGGIPATSEADIDKHYYLAKIWEGVLTTDAVYTPADFTPSNLAVEPKTISVLNRDHSLITKDGKSYVVLAGTWYEAGDVSTSDPTPAQEPVVSSFTSVSNIWGRDPKFLDVSKKTIVFEVLDNTTNKVLHQVKYSPRGYWSASHRFPMMLARMINNLNLSYIKAGEKRGDNFIPIASRYRNKIWLNDLTKKIKIYTVTVIDE